MRFQATNSSLPWIGAGWEPGTSLHFGDIRHPVSVGGDAPSLGILEARGCTCTCAAAAAITLQGPEWCWRRTSYWGLRPVLGMVLGNTLNGISLALDRYLDDLQKQRDLVETVYIHGTIRIIAGPDFFS